jgi:glycosyltransferase involved in cell wall biosynthesis
MSIPVISVLMAAYNVENYIGEAIDSILNQTFNDFEFIIIDDASTDGTQSVIKKYNDRRIKLIENKTNMKLAASLNKGLRSAQGKYIVRMDADDISHPQRIEKLYQFAELNSDIHIVGTQMKVFGSEEGIRKFATTDADIKAGMLWSSPMPHATVIMKLDTILKHNLFYDESFPVGQDWKFWYDMKSWVKFSNLSEPLYYYRRGEQSITQQTSGQSHERYAVMYRIMFAEMELAFTEEELKLHQFVIGQFSILPSLKSIRAARKWLDKLVAQNRKMQIYNIVAFENVAETYWSQLFYKITNFNFQAVVSYFFVTGISTKHFLYYAKYWFNKLTRKK